MRKKLMSMILFGVIIYYGFVLIRNKPWFSNVNADALMKKYSQKEIDHFASFAFQDYRLTKWNTNININTINLSDTILSAYLLKCINSINQLMEEIEITLEKNGNNVQLKFVDTLHLKSGTTTVGRNELKLPYPTISFGMIDIEIKEKELNEINSTIYHEFSHLLGFHHNQPIPYQSAFNPGQRKLIGKPPNEKWIPSFDSYPDIDKAAIRIMYDAEVAIEPGMTKKKFYRKIEEAKKTLNQCLQ